jgi:predicted phage gp36 major capsid-like protein
MSEQPAGDETLTTIHSLVDEEHRLRAHGEAINDEDRARLAQIEEQLDQCWDALRRRRAGTDYGGDPGQATAKQVHDYLQ